ncbi:somatostatin-2-like [Bufo gargarizans]|uniref:somatostatin-2-like n=1 Tax=Bufo gargarizans TaxID=30331 RepID=UPI001CF56A19|nr:somatostatin-2-like [Bufo gargarizans]
MMFLGSAGTILVLLVWGTRGLSQPYDNRMRLGHNQDLGKIQEDLLLKLLSGWTDSTESNSLEMERAAPDNLDTKLIPSVKFPQRERKAPCKNFYWKTFTIC